MTTRLPLTPAPLCFFAFASNSCATCSILPVSEERWRHALGWEQQAPRGCCAEPRTEFYARRSGKSRNCKPTPAAARYDLAREESDIWNAKDMRMDGSGVAGCLYQCSVIDTRSG